MNSQKRLLLTLKYLWEKTDEEHPATLKEIGEYLQQNGIETTRKTLQADINLLMEFGIDIICNHSTAEQHGQRTAGKRSFGDASADWTTARNTVKIHRQLKKEFCRMRSLLLSPGKHKRKGRMFSVSGNTLKCT